MSTSLRPAVFLDRDGTLMEDTGYVADPASVRILPGVVEALARLKAQGFLLIIVTNQSGIGRGYFSLGTYHRVHARMLELLETELIDATYFCADHPDAASDRRKPGAGMLLEAARDHGIDLAQSWMIGDRDGDVLAGKAAGCRTIHLGVDAPDLSHAADRILTASE